MKLHRWAPAAMSVAGAIAVGAGGASASILPGSSPLGLGAAVHSLTRPVGSLLGTVVQGEAAPPAASAAPVPSLPSETAAQPQEQPAAADPAPAAAPAPAAPDPAPAPGTQPAPAAQPAEAPAAATPASEPSQPGTASAGAVDLGRLDTCVGCSGARAGHGAEGHATALRVLGITLAGGSASDGSHDSGALLSLPLDPLVDLRVAGWSVDSHEGGGRSTVTGRSSLLDLGLLGGHLAAISLLEGGSAAGSGPGGTEGAASSTGLGVRVLDGLDVGVLHSSATSDGDRSAQLLTVNGTGLAGSGRTHGDSDTDGSLDADVPGVVDVRLLTTFVSGGVSTGTVLGITDLLGTGPVGSVVSASAGGSTASVPPPSIPLPVVSGSAPAPGGVTASAGTGSVSPAAPVTAAASRAPRIPMTGASVRIAGLVLALMGVLLVALSVRARRIRPAA